jgi:hypothetical protein
LKKKPTVQQREVKGKTGINNGKTKPKPTRLGVFYEGRFTVGGYGSHRGVHHFSV